MKSHRRQTARHPSPRPQRRQGSAPLEFVMAMPLLLLLCALILSVGVFSLGNVKATVNARKNAFQQRTTHKSKLPMAFNQLTSKQDVLRASASETPAYPSPRFNFGTITRNHAVLGGSWDHRELLRGNGPHWTDMGKASIGGGTNQIASLLDQFANGFDPSNLPGLGDMAGGLIGQLLGQADSAAGQFEQLAQEAQRQIQEEVEKLQQKVQELQGQVDDIRKQIDNELKPQAQSLQDAINQRDKEIDNEKNEDKKKELEKEQKQDQEQLDDVNEQISQRQQEIDNLLKQIEANQGLADRL